MKWNRESSNTKKNATSSVSAKARIKFTCLKCGSEITRGSEYHKKRHFQQKHAEEDENESLRYIVQSDHELAVKKRKMDMKDDKGPLKSGNYFHFNALSFQTII